MPRIEARAPAPGCRIVWLPKLECLSGMPTLCQYSASRSLTAVKDPGAGRPVSHGNVARGLLVQTGFFGKIRMAMNRENGFQANTDSELTMWRRGVR